jgi:hypothetical protein
VACLFFVCKYRRQSSNVRQYLHGKLISSSQILLWTEAMTDSRRCSCQNNTSWLEGCSLGAKADNLGNAEYKVTTEEVSEFTHSPRHSQAYSKPQSCRTLPFLRPRILSTPGSGTAAAETITGPAARQFFPRFPSPREIFLF